MAAGVGGSAAPLGAYTASLCFEPNSMHLNATHYRTTGTDHAPASGMASPDSCTLQPQCEDHPSLAVLHAESDAFDQSVMK